ncbi:ribonuclease HIII [Chloroflexota bacterium]
MDFKEQHNKIAKLEFSLRKLRELQLMPDKGENSSDVYNEVCEVVFDEDFYQHIWDEPVLLGLHELFIKRSPEIKLFGERAKYLEYRTQRVIAVNDLYFSILDSSANEEKVVAKLLKILDLEESILKQLQADNKLNNIRSGDMAPSAKIEAFLNHFSEDLAVDFGEWGECMQHCLSALRQREEIGLSNAVLINSQASRAIVIPIKIRIQSGDGKLKHLVSGREDFKSAIERAMQCIAGDGFIKPNDDVLYTLDLTEAEYSGDSIALPAAIAMFSAAKEIKVDVYTAFSGNINLSDRQWAIKSVGGIPQKLQAASAYGCRRIFLPKENEADVRHIDVGNLEIIFVSNLMEVLLKLQTPPERLQGDSLHVQKINKLRAICQGEGWQLSDPLLVQAGLQFIITPPTPPELRLNIYGTGAHSPRKHESIHFQDLLSDLAKLEESEIPIQSVQQVFQIADTDLRTQIRQEFDKMNPSGSREEQYCEYSFTFEDGKQKLIIKQFNSGKLQLQGMAGDLYKRALDVIVTLYNLKYPQAKLVIGDFLQTGPQTSSSKSYREKEIQEVPLPYIGTDESGKGDYFGPMVIAGVWVDASIVGKLESIGVKDSKMLSDKRCRALAGEIRRICKGKYQEVEISPERYNELYEQFRAEKKNLNHLLAWGHARAIESILEHLACSHAVADQFGDEQYIKSRLMQRGKDLKLIQVPKGERYLAVAAASILARDYFLRRLDQISQQVGIALPKGASDAVIAAAKTIVKQANAEDLRKVAKLHFKTTTSVIGTK